MWKYTINTTQDSIYGLNAIPIKIPVIIFVQIEKWITNLCGNVLTQDCKKKKNS